MLEKLREKITGKVHFIGVGGIGMSALALFLRKIGVAVQGSDLRESALAGDLRESGVDYFVGHEGRNIDDEVGLVVKTSIIKDDNCEILAAQEKGLSILTRAELLALVMAQKIGVSLAGTHGKTSTTALVALILEFGGLDPLVINGGVIKHFNSNFKFGEGEFLVAESDESDGSFVDLPTKIGAVTNIEPEHLEFYGGDFDKVKQYYEKYVSQILGNEGFCAICVDDEEACALYEKFAKKAFSYSIFSGKKADLVAKNIAFDERGTVFDAVFAKGREIKGLRLQAFGAHNVANALAAIAIADHLEVEDAAICEALASFSGVERRFNKIGEINGASLIDDYAHHPTEVRAVLGAARQLAGSKKVILVLEPHKYSRVRDLFDEFCACVKDADLVILTEIYSANQKAIDGVCQANLAQKMREICGLEVLELRDWGDLGSVIEKNCEKGDVVLCAGAGRISQMVKSLIPL